MPYFSESIMNSQVVGFEVLTAVNMKMTVFWVVVPCSLVEVYRRFRGACYVHHHPDDYTRYNPEDSHLQLSGCVTRGILLPVE
jgi:hypothetical protein